MAKITPGPLFVSEYVGQLAFLNALQIEAPVFWTELRDLQQRADPDKIVRWMTHTGVVDPWFIEVVWDTVELWSKQPANPRSQLAPNCCWFHYSFVFDEKTLQIPFFNPQFEKPLPLPDISPGLPESTDKFASRIRSEFEGQLQEYVRYLRSIYGEDHTELRQHAQWVALAFTGLSYVRIANKFRGLNQSLQPDTTVKMAVRRFSERIGLTLPGKRRRS